MCCPQNPPFHTSPAVHKLPVNAQVCSQGPQLKRKQPFFLEIKHFQKIWQYSAPGAQICQNFEKYQFSSPFFDVKVHSQDPTS